MESNARRKPENPTITIRGENASKEDLLSLQSRMTELIGQQESVTQSVMSSIASATETTRAKAKTFIIAFNKKAGSPLGSAVLGWIVGKLLEHLVDWGKATARRADQDVDIILYGPDETVIRKLRFRKIPPGLESK
jgi:hypothetical protein